MGCDIHCYSEILFDNQWKQIGPLAIKYNSSENFLTYGNTYVGRNYQLFGLLAGVRSHVNPILPIRDLPNNLSEEIKDEAKKWEGDAHTHHFYYLDELVESKEMFKKISREFISTIENLEFICDKFKISQSDVRIVFWFDN